MHGKGILAQNFGRLCEGGKKRFPLHMASNPCGCHKIPVTMDVTEIPYTYIHMTN
jgi:hypothetical protein